MSKKLIKAFAGYTTFHGLGFIVLPGSSLRRRLIWMFLFVVSMSLMIYQVVDRVVYYHTNPVTVNYRTIYNSSLRFPAVTICNQNQHKASNAEAMGMYTLLKEIHSESFNMSLLKPEHKNITWEEVQLNTTHRKEDLIHRCSFSKKKCSHKDFATTITDYGVCYTFNKDGEHFVSLSGSKSGLHLTLNVEEYEYLPDTFTSVGIEMLVHRQETVPLIKLMGQSLIVDEETAVEPYGVCEDKELKFFEKYTLRNCLTECRATRAVERCGCRLPSMPGNDDGPSEVLIDPTGLSYTLVENTETLGPISCTADCEPDCEYQWTFRDKPESSWSNVTNTNIDSQGSLILRVDNIKRTSAGEYRCIAQNKYGIIRSKTIRVTVNYGSDSATLNPDTVSYTPLENKDTMGPIICSSVCNPPCLYQWLRDGSLVSSMGTLTITDIKRSATGTYQCRVTNKASSISVTSAEIKVSVEYQPEQLVLDPLDLHYNVSENNQLGPIRCSATCNPPCQYQWMQNGVDKTQTAVLDIAQTKRSDTGIYVCVAWNKRGVIESQNIDIKVKYGPDIALLNPDSVSYTLLEHTHTLGPITCSTADCYPGCTYQWLHGGSMIRTTVSITIANITRSNAGIYKCRASNTASSISVDSAEIKVNVEYKPEQLVLNPLDLQYTVRENKQLGPIHCSATCNPPCQYRWKHDGVDKIQTAVLRIAHIKHTDRGIYVCEAWNTRGVIKTQNIDINVQYPPDVPTLTRSTQIDIMGNQPVSLTCTTDSFPLPIISIVSLDTTRKSVSSAGKLTNTLTISKAECLDTGQYQCTATNDIGTSTSDTVTVNVMCAPRSHKRRLTHNIVYIGDEDSLSMTGTVIANPWPALSWMFNSSYKDNTTITVLHNNSDGFKYFESFHHVLYASQAGKSTFHSKDYGQYILKATNSLGDTNVTFNVIAKENNSTDQSVSGVIIGAVLGVVVVIIMIASVVFVLLSRKRRKRKNDIAEDCAENFHMRTGNVVQENNGSEIQRQDSKQDREIRNRDVPVEDNDDEEAREGSSEDNNGDRNEKDAAIRDTNPSAVDEEEEEGDTNYPVR